MQEDQQIWTFINGNLTPGPTEMEESQLEKQLFQNPAFNDLMEILSTGWVTTEEISAGEIEDAFNKVLQRLKDTRSMD